MAHPLQSDSGMAANLFEIARRYVIEVLEEANLDVLRSLVAENFVRRGPMGEVSGSVSLETQVLDDRFSDVCIVIDDIVYIGSANFDVRSLFVNVELMVRIVDAGFAAQMRAFVAGLDADCAVITAASHKARAGWLTRLRWTLAWFVVGVVDYTAARRLNFGLAEPDPEI